MAKLVDQDRLAKLAKALDDRAKAAVSAEKSRAEGAEAALDGKISAEKSRAEAKENTLQAAINTLNGNDSVVGSVDKKIKDAIAKVNTNVTEMEGRLTAAEGKITANTQAISAGDAKTLADAKKYADTQIASLVDSAPEAMNTLKELADAITSHQEIYDSYVATVTAELAKKVDKVAGSRLIAETEVAKFNAKAEVSQVNQALSDAKSYTDSKIGEVNGAAGALAGRVTKLETTVGKPAGDNTAATGLIKDIADIKAKDKAQDASIASAQSTADQAAANIATATGKITALENTVGNTGKGLVKDVADLKAKNQSQDTAISAAQADATKALGDAAAAQSAANKAQGTANGNTTKITALEKTVGNAEAGLVKDVATNAAAIAAINNVSTGILANAKKYTDGEITKVNGKITTLQGTVGDNTNAISTNAAAIAAEKKRAEGKETALQNAINTLNGNAATVGSVDKKIADALGAYTTTNDMKAILNRLIGSLSLSIVGSQIKLNLGGTDGLTLTSATLDLVTDEDIDAIIAGLDEPSPQ